MDLTANSTVARRGGTRLAGKGKESLPGKPLVSVVIAVLNGARHLETSIRSVLCQSYPNVEMLVIDGASTDGTVELLESYGDRIDYWVSEADGGVYEAWNKALKLARGEWIAFLGSDDRYEPDGLAKYVDFIRESGGDFDFISSKVRQLRPDGSARIIGGAWTWRKFRVHMNVAHVGSLHRRNLFDKLGQFNPEYRLVADYEFLLRAGDKLRAGFVGATTAEMRAGGMTDSMKAIEEARRVKIASAARSRTAAKLEASWACVKFVLRKRLGL